MDSPQNLALARVWCIFLVYDACPNTSTRTLPCYANYHLSTPVGVCGLGRGDTDSSRNLALSQGLVRKLFLAAISS